MHVKVVLGQRNTYMHHPITLCTQDNSAEGAALHLTCRQSSQVHWQAGFQAGAQLQRRAQVFVNIQQSHAGGRCTYCE